MNKLEKRTKPKNSFTQARAAFIIINLKTLLFFSSSKKKVKKNQNSSITFFHNYVTQDVPGNDMVGHVSNRLKQNMNDSSKKHEFKNSVEPQKSVLLTGKV